MSRAAKLGRIGAAHLRAVRLSARAWAYYAEETRRWYRVAHADVVEYGRLVHLQTPDAYSRWCAETLAQTMPDGWQPEG